jgi:phospholipase/lecithinase/hemolysin
MKVCSQMPVHAWSTRRESVAYSHDRLAQPISDDYNQTPVCDKPDPYLFWDGNHPTAAESLVIGTDFAKATVGAPLPSR